MVELERFGFGLEIGAHQELEAARHAARKVLLQQLVFVRCEPAYRELFEQILGMDDAHASTPSSSESPGFFSIDLRSASLARRILLRTVFVGAPVALAISSSDQPSTTRSASVSACSSGRRASSSRSSSRRR